MSEKVKAILVVDGSYQSDRDQVPIMDEDAVFSESAVIETGHG